MAQHSERNRLFAEVVEHKKKHSFTPVPNIPWIETAPDAPYFVTDTGANWTPIGQNDAITWPDLQGAFLRKDMERVEQYLQMLSLHGVTCLRLMLEYCHGEHR